MRSRAARRCGRGDRGAGLVATVAGVAAFLALMSLAVQVLYDLYATSVVNAAAFDAARVVAGSGGGPSQVPRAEADARRLLGRYGDRVHFDWQIGGDSVSLRVTAHNPTLTLPMLGPALGLDDVDRTVRVRTERFR